MVTYLFRASSCWSLSCSCIGACVGDDLGAAIPSSSNFFSPGATSPSCPGTNIGRTITSPEAWLDCKCTSPFTNVTSLSSPGAWTGVWDGALEGTWLAGAGTTWLSPVRLWNSKPTIQLFHFYHFLGKFSRWQTDIFPRKQNVTFHANCLQWGQFAWNVKSCFLGKIIKIF